MIEALLASGHVVYLRPVLPSQVDKPLDNESVHWLAYVEFGAGGWKQRRGVGLTPEEALQEAVAMAPPAKKIKKTVKKVAKRPRAARRRR